jgi:hypoxanthine-DNA glycosylase
MKEKHPFKPFVPEQSEILILGSFPGKESTQENRENDWFYGANRNQFWKILELIYNFDLSSKERKQNLLRKLKIAITDIIASCERNENKNSDRNLINKDYNKAILNIIRSQPIKKILFTSKGVYLEFLENFDKPSDTELIVLPSPSPIYRRLSLNDKAQEYKKHLPEL